jgi:hypothetical protein
VFNCSVLTLTLINFHCEIEPANSLQYKQVYHLKLFFFLHPVVVHRGFYSSTVFRSLLGILNEFSLFIP